MKHGDRVPKSKALGSLVRLGTDVAFGTMSSVLPSGRPGIARGAGARRRQLAKLAASVGTTMGTAKLGSIGRSAQEREAKRRAAAQRATQQTIEALGNMKGIAMKIGQLASYAATLSDDAERQLASLQITSAPIPFDAVAHVVATELGRPPDRCFAWFDTEPIAAASVGQVHRARTHGGRDVAVKVQYPGVEDAIVSDLANLEELATVSSLGGGRVDFQPLYDQISTLIRDELDYVAEAESQTVFADAFRGHPLVKVPEVLADLSSRRVLTTEFVGGRTLYEVLDDEPARRDAIGEIIYRFNFGSVFSGFFSGDPHPGNYLFCDDGRVCFLDFGLVKRLERGEAAGLRSLAAAASSDGGRVGEALRGLGLHTDDVDAGELWSEIGAATFGPVAIDTPHRLSKEGYRKDLRGAQKPDSAFAALLQSRRPPAWLSVFLRYAWGTVAVVSRLGAEANWHRVLKELACNTAASTEIGERWKASPVHGAKR